MRVIESEHERETERAEDTLEARVRRSRDAASSCTVSTWVASLSSALVHLTLQSRRWRNCRASPVCGRALAGVPECHAAYYRFVGSLSGRIESRLARSRLRHAPAESERDTYV